MWVITSETVTLPLRDLRKIGQNRKRWIVYGKGQSE